MGRSITMRPAVLALLLFLAVVVGADSSQAPGAGRGGGWFGLSPQGLLDFAQFKSQFHKHYGSLVEELARQRIFLGRALQALLSRAEYRLGRLSYYLAVNHHSDETLAERRRARLSRDKLVEGGGSSSNAGKPAGEGGEKASKEPSSGGGGGGGDKGARPRREANMEGTERVAGASYATKLAQTGWAELGGWGARKARGLRGGENEKQKQLEQQQRKGADGDGADERMFVDLRQLGCFNAPQDQGHCGSCYAFSSVALYEFLYCRATSRLLQFSPQYLIDCGAREQLDGCQGGFLSKTVHFIDHYGLEPADQYGEYKGKRRACPWPADWDRRQMGSIKPIKPADETAGNFGQVPLERLEEYLRGEQRPMLFNLNLTPHFEDYGGGIDSGAGCDEEDVHAMLLVGYGRQHGEDFYLFRNSHGEDWGERGYYKFSKLALARCAASGVAMTSQAQFEPQPELNQNPDYLRPTRAAKRAERLLKELATSPASSPARATRSRRTQ